MIDIQITKMISRSRMKTRTRDINQLNNKILLEYPFEDEDQSRGKITITQHDMHQLKPPNLLNDTIISFFIQYHLDNFVSNEIKNQIHVFNSFFYAKIKCVNVRGSESNNTLKSASRWLKGVEIFTKDHLIIPICDNDHWLMIIISYPAGQPKYENKKLDDKELYEPAVFVLNSVPGSTPTIKRTLCKFLKYQWRLERKSDRNFVIQHTKKTGIRLIFPDIPLQKNSYNCGIFLLNYFYCFLSDPRKAYLRMFRHRNLQQWFIENNINIYCERRRMENTIRKMIKTYNDNCSDDRRTSRGNHEIVICSPTESEHDLSTSPMDVDTQDDPQNSVILIN